MPNMVVKQNNLATDSNTGKPTQYSQSTLTPVKPNSSQYNSGNTFKYTGTSNSGSGRRSGGSGGSGSGSGTVAAGTGDTYWDASSVWSDYLNQMMEAAANTYNSNMNSIANAYNASRNALNANHNMTLDRLASENDRSQRAIGRDADNSQRQAYINKMLQDRNLRQQMSALGMNGGASESTSRSLANNYSNARNQIDTQRNASLSDLANTYENNVSNALQAYNERMAALENTRMSLEQQARAARDSMQASFSPQLNGLAVSNGDYMNLLNQLVANQQAFAYNPTAAVNAPMMATAMQGAGVNSPDYSRYGAWLSQQAMRGADVTQAAQYLLNQGVDRGTINQFLQGYGVSI